VHDFVSTLRFGYETRVGENGIKLSEGQKQRLSIARALIKDPDIIILDEPTSALDSSLEKSIFDALPGMIKGKTLFVVAHRVSTIQECDRILIFDDNHHAVAGTHEELMQQNDYYREMVALQEKGIELPN
jgi:ABC-type multidrug transport system fused ATPase/permease subunit